MKKTLKKKPAKAIKKIVAKKIAMPKAPPLVEGEEVELSEDFFDPDAGDLPEEEHESVFDDAPIEDDYNGESDFHI